jgi:hypothetical protein
MYEPNQGLIQTVVLMCFLMFWVATTVSLLWQIQGQLSWSGYLTEPSITKTSFAFDIQTINFLHIQESPSFQSLVEFLFNF